MDTPEQGDCIKLPCKNSVFSRHAEYLSCAAPQKHSTQHTIVIASFDPLRGKLEEES
jgi:hypothetical protein